MIILGISGFEDFDASGPNHIYSSASKRIEDILCFSEDRIPLQFFPLHLIGHDSSAAILVDGKLIAFAAEERLTRMKHGFNLAGRTVLPRNAINYCLKEANISWSQIDYIAHYCDFKEEVVKRRFENVVQGLNPSYRSLVQNEYRLAYKNRLSKDILLQQLGKFAGEVIPEDRLIQVKHHLAHAAGTFYSSNFKNSLILTLDGYGEEESSIWAIGGFDGIHLEGSIKLPTSLGLLYQVITAYLGFRSFGDEYKVMGLSSYGEPRVFKPVFDELVRLLPDGTYSINNLSRADLLSWLRNVLGEIPSKGEFSQKAADIASALQKILEDAILHTLTFLRKKYPLNGLCLSGGVGLNACANGAILRSALFDKIFFQPASSDDGASLGAALYVYRDILKAEHREPIQHVFWGPGYSSFEIEAVLLNAWPIKWKKESEIEEIAAELLAEGKVVGWFQGRMEMGPRALGARSILADPRSTELRDKINRGTKNREFFRPFAPSAIEDEARMFFDIPPGVSSPFMLATFQTYKHQQEKIPGVVHIDGSARLQTVSAEDNPRYYRLLQRFYERTGIPILLNTSFNRAGEPIVNSPEDALKCFLRCNLDALIIEDYLVLPNEITK
jgi:carbamoyltransferase